VQSIAPQSEIHKQKIRRSFSFAKINIKIELLFSTYVTYDLNNIKKDQTTIEIKFECLKTLNNESGGSRTRKKFSAISNARL
jgi:hypothetical protein